MSRYRVVRSGSGFRVYDSYSRSYYAVTFVSEAVAESVASGANADAAAAQANSRLARVA